MNRKSLVVCLVIVVVSLILMVRFVAKRENPVTEPKPTEIEANQKEEFKASPASAAFQGESREISPTAAEQRSVTHATASGGHVTVPTSQSELLTNVQQAVVQQLQQLAKPIGFYGRTVDEQGRPVEGVHVDLRWNNPSLSKEATETIAFTDAQGNFALQDAVGLKLSVALSKEGYYVSRKNAVFDFIYARELGGNFHEPDAANPVIFRLKKKGEGTTLITSEHGVDLAVTAKPATDGSPLGIDLLTQSIGTSGQLFISQWKPQHANWKTATEWGFRMAIADGGFVEHEDEFPFYAPKAGYHPLVEFRFKVGDPQWAAGIHKSFYISFGTPRRYGWLTVDTSIDRSSVRLEYAVNPTGANYLEPKEKKVTRRPLPPGAVEVIPK